MHVPTQSSWRNHGRMRSCVRTIGGALCAAVLVAGCAQLDMRSLVGAPLPDCDDTLKAAFTVDAQTTVVAVRQVKKGEALVAVDSTTPITMAGDACLVKLLVGPGVRSEPKTAPSHSEGIGIEVWLPERARWNERIRDYGGGGWVGGGHRTPDKIGSKVPALVNANMGYAVGTTDSGQPDYQGGSFILKADGTINNLAMRDFSWRATVEQALKTRALVQLYYGKDAAYAYFDGHSQGGRQGLKLAQDAPELYDGFLIAAPAISQEKFSLSLLNVQIVMRELLGFTALDQPRAKAFAAKVVAANGRAVAACDKESLGFLLDPFSCDYAAVKDPLGLCAGVAAEGVTGISSNAEICLSLKEAEAIDRIWHGATTDGLHDPNPPAVARNGRSLGVKQLWWSNERGADFSGPITNPETDRLVMLMQDAGYASSMPNSYTSAGKKFVNDSTAVRDKWKDLTYAELTSAIDRSVALQPALGYLSSDNPDLTRARSLGRKVVIHHGLAEDVIPPAGMVNYYTRVVERMDDGGGDTDVHRFLRLYFTPGVAHSLQGRAYTIGNGKNDTVPIPKLPGNNNQAPTRDQDQMFTALVDWVEKGIAPDAITITSRDNSVSYPICVYPLKTTWDGSGSARLAASYRCK